MDNASLKNWQGFFLVFYLLSVFITLSHNHLCLVLIYYNFFWCFSTPENYCLEVFFNEKTILSDQKNDE